MADQVARTALSISRRPGRDCRRERLISAVGDAGWVVVYGNHEKLSIRRLQNLFLDLAVPLERIQSRLLDLFPIMSRHVYHPSFGGVKT
jgi:Domain of unknown function(DUF2779)